MSAIKGRKARRLQALLDQKAHRSRKGRHKRAKVPLHPPKKKGGKPGGIIKQGPF
jgi:hypothetical protein